MNKMNVCDLQWQVGNWSVELACSSLSSGRNVGIQVHAKLDRSEMLWLKGALGKRCLRATAGYTAGDDAIYIKPTVSYLIHKMLRSLN